MTDLACQLVIRDIPEHAVTLSGIASVSAEYSCNYWKYSFLYIGILVIDPFVWNNSHSKIIRGYSYLKFHAGSIHRYVVCYADHYDWFSYNTRKVSQCFQRYSICSFFFLVWMSISWVASRGTSLIYKYYEQPDGLWTRGRHSMRHHLNRSSTTTNYSRDSKLEEMPDWKVILVFYFLLIDQS